MFRTRCCLYIWEDRATDKVLVRHESNLHLSHGPCMSMHICWDNFDRAVSIMIPIYVKSRRNILLCVFKTQKTKTNQQPHLIEKVPDLPLIST